LNCAAIPETLLESELFGHEKGAFTGADRRKEGKFRQAEGGSLFLDEIGEMPLTMQVKLLRVLQERELTRVGGEEVLPIDVRLIAATNRDLIKDIGAGRFREDLFYRLNVVTLAIPPLRERREDIPLLAQEFLTGFSEKNKKKISGFTPRAMDRLLRHFWPGNVRELMNAIERAVVLSRGDYLDEGELSLLPAVEEKLLSESAVPNAGPASTDLPANRETIENSEAVPKKEPVSLEEAERETILRTLTSVEGNKSEAARRLGITRRTLHKKLKKYNMM
jgi:two-component system response regulator HydG